MVIGSAQELSDMIRLGGLKRYNSIRYLVMDEVDACLQLGSSSSSSTSQFNVATGSSSTATPLHELLSKYLSPTLTMVALMLPEKTPLLGAKPNPAFRESRKKFMYVVTIYFIHHAEFVCANVIG